MMTSGKKCAYSKNSPPALKFKRIALVSRDYNHIFGNGYRDFSHALQEILELADQQQCDAVVFSLFSIVRREQFDVLACFKHLINVKAVLLEEYKDNGGDDRDGKCCYLYCKEEVWKEYPIKQKFGSIRGMKENELKAFADKDIPKRTFGNGCVLLCGESNGVKYSQAEKQVRDDYGIKSAIPNKVNVILNPLHDRMTRFEMNLKRAYLSTGNRWVLSVWNKGRMDKNGKIKDGSKPAWGVFYDGENISDQVRFVENNLNIEIGIVEAN